MNKLFITILFFVTTTLIYGQKDERFGWGQYTEVNSLNYQNYPYTLFNRTIDLKIERQKENIQLLIFEGQPLQSNPSVFLNEIAQYFNELYTFATGPLPAPDETKVLWAQGRAPWGFNDADRNG